MGNRPLQAPVKRFKSGILRAFLLFFFIFLLEIFFHTVGNSLGHQLLEFIILHLLIFVRIGHVPHLDDRDRHFAPVDAAHCICLPDALLPDAGSFCIGIQDQF